MISTYFTPRNMIEQVLVKAPDSNIFAIPDPGSRTGQFGNGLEPRPTVGFDIKQPRPSTVSDSR